jgi:hypothetical protein
MIFFSLAENAARYSMKKGVFLGSSITLSKLYPDSFNFDRSNVRSMGRLEMRIIEEISWRGIRCTLWPFTA